MTHAYVGGASFSQTTSSTTISVTYSPTAGNGIFVHLAYEQSSVRALAGFTDQSNTPLTHYLVGTGLQNDTQVSGFYLAWIPNLPSGITAIKGVLGQASSAGLGIDVREFSGLSTVAPTGTWYAQLEATATTATDNVTSGLITPSAQPGLLYAVSNNIVTNAAPNAGTGFTTRATPAYAMVFFTQNYKIESKDISALTAVAGTFTNTGSSGNLHQTAAAYIFDQAPPATLSSPGSTAISDVQATATATSDTGGGTFYGVLTSTNSQPTNAQIKAGSGGTIVKAGTSTGTVGTNSVVFSTLTASTTYYAWMLQNNGADSNVVTTSFTTTAAAPSITSVSTATPRYLGALTINGPGGTTGFNSTQSGGDSSVGSVTQTETSWSDTAVGISSLARGTNKYGTALTVTVTNGVTGLTSAGYAGITGMLPQTGWSYVNVATPNTTSSFRITAVADIASGDQLAYDNKSGLVTVFDDGTFSADASVTSFDVECWTTGSGWGSTGTQTTSGATAGVKSIAGLAIASVKSIGGLAIASVKSFSGIATQ